MKFILVSLKYVVSVGKKHSNTGKRRSYRAQKRNWNVYFYDESGVFHSKRVKWYEALYYKTKKVKVNDK